MGWIPPGIYVHTNTASPIKAPPINRNNWDCNSNEYDFFNLMLVSKTKKVKVKDMNFIIKTFTQEIADSANNNFVFNKMKEVAEGRNIIDYQITPVARHDLVTTLLITLTLEKLPRDEIR